MERKGIVRRAHTVVLIARNVGEAAGKVVFWPQIVFSKSKALLVLLLACACEIHHPIAEK